MNLNHIIEGWSKTMGLMEVTPANQALSRERLAVCAKCPFAKESSFLKFIKGNGVDVEALYCKKCGCPVNEKSLVEKEKCPIGNWK